MSEQRYLSKQPHWDDEQINNPEGCSSSDAVTVYQDGSACCFSCGQQLFPKPSQFNYFDWVGGRDGGKKMHQNVPNDSNGTQNGLRIELRNYERATFKGFPERNITITTAQRFGVKTDVHGNVYFPYYDRSNNICGFKIRTPDKDFRSVGKVIGEDVQLFGAQLFKPGGKYVTIHEGEFDAMAGYQMMGSKFPNLSVPTGAKGAPKAIRFSIDVLETYDKKVLSLDGDKAGKEAADKCAPIFDPGTCLIMNMPEDKKDACEFSKANLGAIYMSLFWEARMFTPSGIVNLGEDFEGLFVRKNVESIKYPWEGMNEKLSGLRYKELITFCSGSGMGKSTIIKELCYWLLLKTEDNIGVLFLEEDNDRTKLGLMGIHANRPLHLDEVFQETDKDTLRESFDATVGTGRFYAFNHFGSTGVDEILNRVRYLIKGLECKWIILDHLSIIVSGIDNDDERKAIDLAMTKLRTIVEETGAGMLLVSHLKRLQGDRGHENGGIVSLNHLRGSQSIAQLSDAVVGLERDQQHDNPLVANTTRLRVLKNRYSGKVGLAGYLLYDHTTGRMTEVSEDDLAMGEDPTDEF